MGDPYLDRGESLILTTHRISVNFFLYDMMLTTRHLVLVDSSYIRFEPWDIPLVSILSVTAGFVATGEPVIIITFVPDEEKEQGRIVTLIFTQQTGEQRKEERDLWVRRLMEMIVAVRQSAPEPITPPANDGQRAPQFLTAVPLRGIEMPPPHRSVVRADPAPIELDVQSEKPETTVTQEQVTVPVEQEVMTVEHSPGGPAKESAVSDEPFVRSLRGPGVPGMDERADWKDGMMDPDGTGKVELSADILEVTAIPDLFGSAARAVKESARGKVTKNCVPARTGKGAIPVPTSEPVKEPQTRDNEGSFMVDRVPANPEAEGTEPDPGPTILQTVPVEDYDESRVVPATEEDRQLPVMPVLLQSVSSSVRTALVIVVFTIVLFAIIGGVLSFQNLSPASLPVITVPPVISPATPSPIITIPIVTPVPRNTIPTDGVWIRASYNGSYIGLYGNPGSLQHVRGSGDMFYRIRDNGGLVQASFQKQDNSGETLGIEVYRNGSVIATRSVRAPMGSIDFIIDSATGSFPGGIPSRPSATGLVPGKIYR